VHKGFAAYSFPGSAEIKAVSGTFLPLDTGIFNSDQVFVLNPWMGKPEMLSGKIHSELAAIEGAFLEIELPEQDFEFTETQASEWRIMIEEAIELFERGELQKVVLSRSEMVEFHRDIWSAFKRAVEQNLQAFVYIVYHPLHGLWFGATPELLLKGREGEFETVALAGTLTPEQSEWSNKEERENSVTDEFVREMIDGCGGKNVKIGGREELQSGQLRHLVVRYFFHLDEGVDQYLLRELHPTPAVGGQPRNRALQFIEEHEKHRRGLYTGWIGVMGANQMEVYVNLRCARIFKSSAILYAGAGINSASNWQLEWKETSEKMNVIGKYLNG
jgi:isochorismate synthase